MKSHIALDFGRQPSAISPVDVESISYLTDRGDVVRLRSDVLDDPLKVAFGFVQNPREERVGINDCRVRIDGEEDCSSLPVEAHRGGLAGE